MKTPWHLLNPLTNTAILLPAICDDGRDILIDMSCAGNDLPAALAARGRTIADIAHILITHDHGDHFLPESARCFLGTNTLIHIVEYGYQRLMKDPVFASVRPIVLELDAAGLFRRLPNSGQANFSGVEVFWQNTWHLDTINLSFRIRDILISGDTPYSNLFTSPSAPIFASGSSGPIRTAILQTTLLDARDARTRDERESDIQKRLTCTGTGEALIELMKNPDWATFFCALETIVPHHLRCYPLEDLANAIRTAFTSVAREQGYTFNVQFE